MWLGWRLLFSHFLKGLLPYLLCKVTCSWLCIILKVEALIFQREFEEICNHFKTHEHARLILKYDEALSHLIYAASDMLIIPSIFEPCGLTQVSWRHGTIMLIHTLNCCFSTQGITCADDCYEIWVGSSCQKDWWTKRQVKLASHTRAFHLPPLFI